MTLTFDQDAYRNLLAEVAPKLIETEYAIAKRVTRLPYTPSGILRQALL